MNKNLKPCPSCSKEIANSATTCPHCGKSFTSLARIGLIVILAVIICWFLGAFRFIPLLFR